jgi:hypothetical protein
MTIEPRPLPAETIEGLLPPRAGFPYFAHADHFPFQPEAIEYSDRNAWWLADACFLVYGDAPFIRAAFAASPLPDQGFHLDWLGTSETNQGIVLSNDGALVVVFRGTRLQVHSLLDAVEVVIINQDDLRADSQFLPAVNRAGGRVHSGFLKAFSQISDWLDATVQARQPGQALWLTGHSLGGALATLAAAHLGRAAIQGLYTYGCPRFGDAAFAAVLPQQSYHRFVHRDDWVTTVPPEFLGYVHAGTRQPVLGSPTRSFLDDLTSGAGEVASVLTALATELRLSVGGLPFKISGLADHAPIYYATLLWNAFLSKAPAI